MKGPSALIPRSIRQFENIHLPFWLVKDTCWMLEWRTLGVLMIVPTLGIALTICFRSRNSNELLLHLATLCWITANSFWMCCEFYSRESWKYYAGIPFGLGMLLVAGYYFQRLRKHQQQLLRNTCDPGIYNK